MHGLLGGGYDT